MAQLGGASCLAREGRLEQAKHKPLRGEFHTVTHDKSGFSCERFQLAEQSSRAGGKLGARDGFEHTEIAGLLTCQPKRRSLLCLISLIFNWFRRKIDADGPDSNGGTKANATLIDSHGNIIKS